VIVGADRIAANGDTATFYEQLFLHYINTGLIAAWLKAYSQKVWCTFLLSVLINLGVVFMVK